LTSAAANDPDELIIDGLMRFSEAMNDLQMGKAGGMVYASVKEAVRPRLGEGTACAIAFPSMIIRPDIRTECFVAVLSSEVIVAWKKGLFRKTVESEVIPRSSIVDATVGAGTSASTRGATLLTIRTKGDRSVTVALPKGKPEVATLIRSEIVGGA
jgi:hypothetical protein